MIGILATSGCLRLGGSRTEVRPDAVGIHIENNTPDSRQVTISATNSETEFRKTYQVPANSTVAKSGLLPTGMYRVTVEVEGVGKDEHDWYMSGCETNDIAVMFSETGISIGAACYDD